MERGLILKIRNGEQQAFRELYDLYFDYAMRSAIAITSNHATAADVVQETFIRVYRNIQDFDKDREFKPWFYRILVNECNRYLKKYSKVIPIEINEDLDLPPDNDLHAFMEYEDLYKGIQKLDDLHRVPLVLKYLNDFTDHDIALVLESNVNTVKSRLFKGKRKLKEILIKEKEA